MKVRRHLATSPALKKLWSAALVALALAGPCITMAQDAPAPAAPEAAAAAPAAAPAAEAPASEAAAPAAAPKCGDKGFECNKGDVAWMMTSTAFVLFMTVPGLA